MAAFAGVFLTLVVIGQHIRSGRLNRHGSGTNFTFSQLGFVVGRVTSGLGGGCLLFWSGGAFSLLLYSTGCLLSGQVSHGIAS
jgi:hypothetical protein